MISAVKEISKEIDWGDDLKQVCREELSKKVAFKLKEEPALQRIRGELYRQKDQRGQRACCGKELGRKVVCRPKRSSANSGKYFIKLLKFTIIT